jgi:hypothetical protein
MQLSLPWPLQADSDDVLMHAVAVLNISALFYGSRAARRPFLSSFVFASVICGLSLHTLLTRHTRGCEALMVEPHPNSHFCLALTFAYMTADIFWSTNLRTSMLVHHLMAVAIVLAVQHSQSGYGVGAWVGLNEFSTLFLSTMREVPAAWQLIFRLLFAVSFFICRVLLLPVVLVQVWPCSDNAAWYPVMTFLLLHTCLNFFWMHAILRKCLRQLSAQTKNKFY